MQIGISGQLNASDKCLNCLDTEAYSVVNDEKSVRFSPQKRQNCDRPRAKAQGFCKVF